jgi:hypothetical protein
MEVWRITKWDEVFENAESRRIKNLDWVAWPINLGSAGYDSLIEEFGPDAPAIYGAWCVLVCVAAKCPVRGTLTDSKGRPMSVSRIAMKAHMPAEVFQRLVDWASTEGVQWIEVTTHPAPAHSTPIARPANPPPTGDETRRDETTGQRPSVRQRLSDSTEIVVDDDGWKLIAATTLRIARVVTKNPDADLQRLASPDRRLCIRAASLAEWRYGADWLNEILEKLSDRKKKPDNPWGYFRNALATSIQEQFGELLRETEKYVQNRIGRKTVAP